MVSLAIVRPVSLRLQDSGQKNSRIKRMHTESLTTDLFLTFAFSIHRDSKRICKRDRLRLLRFSSSYDMLLSCVHIYVVLRKASATHLQDSFDSFD